MIPDPSLLGVASATARHAAHVQAVTARNVARADVPGARAEAPARFAEALRAFGSRRAPAARETDTPIELRGQLTAMAHSAGRHEAAVLIYAKALDMMRLAGGAPR